MATIHREKEEGCMVCRSLSGVSEFPFLEGKDSEVEGKKKVGGKKKRKRKKNKKGRRRRDKSRSGRVSARDDRGTKAFLKDHGLVRDT